MNSEVTISYQDLYKILKIFDKKFYKQFDNDKLNDEEYFNIAIKGELTSHAIAITINFLENNSCSQGLDTNLRTIIEDIAIYKTYKEGGLTENNFKIFRKMFILVESINFKKQIDDPRISNDQKEQLNDAKSETIKEIAELLKCSKKEIKKTKYCLDLPTFFLMNDIKKPVNMNEVVANELGKEMCQYYKNLGMRVHPYYCDQDTNSMLINVRNEMISKIFNDVLSVLCDWGELPDYKEEESFQHEITMNKDYSEHYQEIQKLKKLIDDNYLIIKKNNVLRDPYDEFVSFQLRSLWYDSRICLMLGYSEQVVAKFKSFMEVAAVNGMIRTHVPQERIYVINAFKISTLVQEQLFVNNVLKEEPINIFEKEISELYSSYYKDKYNISFEDFKTGFIKNSYFFLDKGKKNYNGMVKELLENYFPLEEDRGDALELYKVSKDFNHGGGYIFDSSLGVAEKYAIKCVDFMQKYFVSLFLQCNKYIGNNSLKTMIVELENEFNLDFLRFF
jgi:hypothetical protein